MSTRPDPAGRLWLDIVYFPAVARRRAPALIGGVAVSMTCTGVSLALSPAGDALPAAAYFAAMLMTGFGTALAPSLACAYLLRRLFWQPGAISAKLPACYRASWQLPSTATSPLHLLLCWAHEKGSVDRHEGFREFVLDRQQALRQAAYLLVGDVHLAEDLLQSVLAKVAGQWHRLGQGSNPEAYTHRALVNQHARGG